jgi:UDP-N-acetylmuramoylalanine-D-glutamate ligase
MRKHGNIGSSFAKAVTTSSPDYWVLELSSFQLEDIDSFHPRYAVMTNLTPDHLDRYDNSFERYVDAKFCMLKNQTNEDYVIICIIIDEIVFIRLVFQHAKLGVNISLKTVVIAI